MEFFKNFLPVATGRDEMRFSVSRESETFSSDFIRPISDSSGLPISPKDSVGDADKIS